MSFLGNIFKTLAPSVLGSMFGGGGSVIPQSGIQTNVSGLVNTPQLLADAASSFSQPGGSNWLGNLLSGVDVGSALDTSGWTAAPDPVGTINYQPANIFSNVPGLVDTPSILNTAGGLLSGGGGNLLSNLLNGSTAPPTPQDPMNVQPAQAPQTNVPDLVNTPQLLNTAGQIINGQQPNTGADGGNSKPFDLTKWLTTIAGAGGLANLLGGQQNDLGPDADKLRAMAGDISGQRSRLMDTSLANQQGMINDQALNAIERRLRASEAGMRGKYAEMGMSGSTMEQEDLANLRQKAQDEIFATGQQMAVTGLQTAAQMTGQESTIYQVLMNAQIQKDQELGRVLAEFAAASAR